MVLVSKREKQDAAEQEEQKRKAAGATIKITGFDETTHL